MTDLKTLFKTAPLTLLLVIAFLLGGCGGGEATPAATPAAATEAASEAASEAATEAAARATTAITTTIPTTTSVIAPQSPLAPSSPLPTPEVNAQVTSETGSIVGRILVTKPDGEIAVADMIIGLAEVIRDEAGVAKVGGYEPSRALRVTTDAYGRFIMNDVKPGSYTLILDAVVTQYQLADEKTGNTILVDVKPGEITDLGTLRYSSLPVPGFH